MPSLVIHGAADPLFLFSHGQALVDEMPTAWLLGLDGAGHGLDGAYRDTVIPAIWTQAAAAPRTRG